MNFRYTILDMHILAESKDLLCLSQEYTSCSKKHTWKCNKCQHIWVATPSNIRKQKGCPKCAGQCQSVETMRRLAQLCGLEFLSNDYRTMKTKYKWKCHNGHISLITADSVKKGVRCSYCHKGVKEEECRFIVENLTGHKFPVGRIIGLELDGYCPNLNIAFEYNGKQHYEFMPYFHKSYTDFEKQIQRDNKKAEACRKSGIKKLDISYLKASNRKSLTKYIQTSLKNLNIAIQETDIKWENFHGKRKFLEETIENATRVNAICLSKIYVTAKTKLAFQCKTCNHVWWSTPSNIKTGYGCIKCSYSYKRWETRRRSRYLLTVP
ncbi:hypothetical protein LCGC14_2471280 [marine sediment metagenome]|uniref:Treble clef zinc finger domain-containing protein n=1 Tax=marine sediment metagenome TaxID=412755 RepID=A0A0F9DME1_9ZZZZ